MSDDGSTNAGAAFGRPGIPPRWTSSAKEGWALHMQPLAASGSLYRTAF